MKTLPKLIRAVVLIAAGVAMLAPSPDASSEHFVIVNNSDSYMGGAGNNYGTVLKLGGTKNNPVLSQAASLATGEPSPWGGGSYAPLVQVVAAGSDICVFMTELYGTVGTSEISAFKYPGMTLVGNYGNSIGSGVIVASGGYLFASYYYEMGAWKIGEGCSLTQAGMYSASYGDASDMAATPDGKTLAVSAHGSGGCCLYSWSISTGGALTEHGPYYITGVLPWGVDVTADSKFALFDVQGYGPPYDDGDTEIDVLAINSDGSLGEEYAFGGDNSLGTAYSGGWIHLSPDEEFLFVTDDEQSITTVNFSENPVNITWSGCLTKLRIPKGDSGLANGSIAAAGTVGTGSAIYVSEQYEFSSVALLNINSLTGCTTEAESSPFVLSDTTAKAWSLVAWPPRLF